MSGPEATKPSLREQLATIAAAPGVRDPLSINIWKEGPEGEIQSEPGLFVSIRYQRADGGKRLRAQLGGNTRTKGANE